MRKVIILGSGIQGVSCAFALSKKGYDVTLVEKAKEVFNRTTKNNEGRIHLGFTYAKDKSMETGKLVLRSALTFSSTFEEWFGKVDWSRYLLAAKGYYLVHKNTRLLSEEEIISYYKKLNNIYSEYIQDGMSLSYFGYKPKKLFRVLDNIPKSISKSRITRAIETEERLIEMFYFRDLIIENLKQKDIHILTETEAKQVERKKAGFIVLVINKGHQERKLKADIVVNCLWNNRIMIDKTLGITTLDNPMYRFKYGILGKVKKMVPNCSIVSGPFGNIEPRLDGKYAYISWHPECVRGITTDGTTPPTWEKSFEVSNNDELNSNWVLNSIKELCNFVPALKAFKPYKLLPGISCTAGKTDIQDKDSQVHFRSKHMGIYSFDGYFSIDTGKFVSAPLFAKELVKKVEQF